MQGNNSLLWEAARHMAKYRRQCVIPTRPTRSPQDKYHELQKDKTLLGECITVVSKKNFQVSTCFYWQDVQKGEIIEKMVSLTTTDDTSIKIPRKRQPWHSVQNQLSPKASGDECR